MDDDILERVKLLIKRKLSDEGITRLHISWFGGEPLMAYDRVCALNAFAKGYAEEHGKSFSSSITTNGTLLTPERIETLRNLGISHYQITIDGDRKTHNSIKRLGTISAYDRTLDNVNTIARHTSVSLRFNYTSENLKPDLIFKTLKEKLNTKVLHNIAFTIFKVWQQNKNEINATDVDALFLRGVETGMYSTLGSSGLCYTDRYHFDCVFPNGRVGKCDNRSPEEAPGVLQPNGTILWEEYMGDYYEPHLFDNRQTCCTACRYLPICWGPCVSKREDMLGSEGNIRCKYNNPDKDMETMISNLCKTKLQRTR